MLTLIGEKVKIIRKDAISKNNKPYTTYAMMVSSKDMEGNWVSGFLNCRFKKGVEVNNKAKIKIAKAFPIASKWNEQTTITWMITEFEVDEVGEVAEADAIASAKTNDDFMNLDEVEEGELPFI